MPVSGRIAAIAVHPTNENIAYVGAAQGGVYRTLNGGASWTPLLDNALTLAIGAITIDPIDPTIVYAGTGEANFSADSFFGVGLYIIRNADSGSPSVNGPFNSNGSSGFNNAVLRTINLALGSSVPAVSGDTLSIKLSVNVGTTGHRSGTARLWYNDSAADSHFDATISGVTQNYYLLAGSALGTSPGPGPKLTSDVFVDRAVGGNPFKSFGTWTTTLP